MEDLNNFMFLKAGYALPNSYKNTIFIVENGHGIFPVFRYSVPKTIIETMVYMVSARYQIECQYWQSPLLVVAKWLLLCSTLISVVYSYTT
jgi:hypothetical protein